MKWSEVRRMYPNQYVKLKIIDSYLEGDKKIVTDVALVNVIEDPKLATKELLKSKGDTIVYHTRAEEIKIEMRKTNRFKRYKMMKLKFVNHLLEATMTIFYKGKKKTIDKLVIETAFIQCLEIKY